MFDRFVPLSAVVCRERLWMTPMDSIIVIKTLLRKFLKKKKVSISLAIHALIDTKSPNAIQS